MIDKPYNNRYSERSDIEIQVKIQKFLFSMLKFCIDYLTYNLPNTSSTSSNFIALGKINTYDQSILDMIYLIFNTSAYFYRHYQNHDDILVRNSLF